MNENQFKVIFTGKLKQDADINRVANAFAIRFKLPPEKALKILQAGREVVLNPRAEHLKAYKLKSIFEEMGMETRLERAMLVAKVEKPVEADEQQEQQQEQAAEENTASENKTHVQTPKASDSWTMSPVESNDPADQEQGQSNQQYSQRHIPRKRTTKKTPKEKNGNALGDTLKTIAGWIGGIFAGLFILLKKFGLWKLLKVGIFMAAASAIGFDSEEACMDNSQCEDAVDDQIDACWEDNGFEDIDWDNIEADEFMRLKPRIEKDFIGCFLYPETGDRIFLSPIELRFGLVDSCEESNISNCNEIVEPQIKGCFEQAHLGRYFNEDTSDYYAVFYQHPEAIQRFYACFKDENGNNIIDYEYDYSD